jgi:hypothetical protein
MTNDRRRNTLLIALLNPNELYAVGRVGSPPKSVAAANITEHFVLRCVAQPRALKRYPEQPPLQPIHPNTAGLIPAIPYRAGPGSRMFMDAAGPGGITFGHAFRTTERFEHT